ncbi:hypothetical protein SLA2020_468770 [Shorea laevis]
MDSKGLVSGTRHVYSVGQVHREGPVCGAELVHDAGPLHRVGVWLLCEGCSGSFVEGSRMLLVVGGCAGGLRMVFGFCLPRAWIDGYFGLLGSHG